MKHRLLSPEEFYRVASVFAERKLNPPSPEMSAIAVVEDGLEIASFLVLQPALHLEPVWIHPDYRGKVMWRGMVKLLEEKVTKCGGGRLYAFCPDEHIGKMLTAAGFNPTIYKVWEKEVR